MASAPKAGTWKLETINPQRAQQYLKLMGPNRRLRESRVDFLADQMKNGHWRLSHQGIAFNCDGSLKDGQHRLAAVMRSGVPVSVWVYRGLANDAMLTLDTHAVRSEADALTISGMPCDTNMVAAARRMMRGMDTGSSGKIDREFLREYIVTHGDALAFALTNIVRVRGIYKASVIAVVARAFYTVDRDRLREFCEVLSSGEANKKADGAAVKLRLWIAETPLRSDATGQSILYRKTASALRAFLDGRTVSKLYEASDELFPMPEESGK